MGGEAPPIILFNKQFLSFFFLKGGGVGGEAPPTGLPIMHFCFDLFSRFPEKLRKKLSPSQGMMT